MPAALAVDWAEIRSASEQGVSDPDLQAKFGVSKNAIQQRRFREKWITPATIAQEALVQQARNKARGMGNQSIVRGVSETPTAIAVVASTVAEKGEAHALRVLDFASRMTAEAIAGEKVPTPSNWKELDTADRMARRAAGLDKPQTNVQINVGGMFGAMAEGVTIEVGDGVQEDSEDGT